VLHPTRLDTGSFLPDYTVSSQNTEVAVTVSSSDRQRYWSVQGARTAARWSQCKLGGSERCRGVRKQGEKARNDKSYKETNNKWRDWQVI